MAKHSVGEKVKVKETLAALPQGTEGRIHSVHETTEGAFYGIHAGGYIGYAPENSLMEAPGDADDHDGDADDTPVMATLQKLSVEQLRSLISAPPQP